MPALPVILALAISAGLLDVDGPECIQIAPEGNSFGPSACAQFGGDPIGWVGACPPCAAPSWGAVA